MVLIFGGAYQGKLDYALERFDLTIDDVGYCIDGDSVYPQDKKVIYEIDKWILSLIRNDINVMDEIKRFLEDNKDTKNSKDKGGDIVNCKDKIVICNDISCGVVPIDPVMRRWRDEVGKSLGLLAQNSNEVIRLYCGIPTKLK